MLDLGELEGALGLLSVEGAEISTVRELWDSDFTQNCLAVKGMQYAGLKAWLRTNTTEGQLNEEVGGKELDSLKNILTLICRGAGSSGRESTAQQVLQSVKMPTFSYQPRKSGSASGTAVWFKHAPDDVRWCDFLSGLTENNQSLGELLDTKVLVSNHLLEGAGYHHETPTDVHIEKDIYNSAATRNLYEIIRQVANSVLDAKYVVRYDDGVPFPKKSVRNRPLYGAAAVATDDDKFCTKPDVAFVEAENKVAPVVEYKYSDTIKVAETVICNIQNAVPHSWAQHKNELQRNATAHEGKVVCPLTQLYAEMTHHQSKFGILTDGSADHTYFFERTEEQVDHGSARKRILQVVSLSETKAQWNGNPLSFCALMLLVLVCSRASQTQGQMHLSAKDVRLGSLSTYPLSSNDVFYFGDSSGNECVLRSGIRQYGVALFQYLEKCRYAMVREQAQHALQGHGVAFRVRLCGDECFVKYMAVPDPDKEDCNDVCDTFREFEHECDMYKDVLQYPRIPPLRIPKLYFTGQIQDNFVLITSYEGVSLNSEEGSQATEHWSDEELREGISRALESLHGIRVLHGDAYARNILIGAEGIKLTDFGRSILVSTQTLVQESEREIKDCLHNCLS